MATPPDMNLDRQSAQPEPDPTRRAAADPRLWLDQHGDALFRYAVIRVRDAAAAEELVQETLLAALRARDRFSARSTERTWLIAILRRKIVDHFRASRSAQSFSETGQGASGEHFDERGHWKTTVSKWTVDPERVAADAELREALRKCIAQLPSGLAEAFILRELEQLEPDEVCKVLDISASNLWTRLHRARMALRRCLEKAWSAVEGGP